MVMIRNAGWLVLVAVALASSSAWAGPLSLWIGETKFLGFQSRSAKVTISDPSVIEVETSRSGAEIRAKRPGVSHVTLKLHGGETYEFAVHVTPKGAEVYSTDRAESEHAGFSVSAAPKVGKASTKARTRSPSRT
jgi:hypothetical protein